MKIDDHEFTFVCELRPARDEHGAVLQMMPQEKYAKRESTRLNRYGAGTFCKFKIPNGFQTAGVYVTTLAEEWSTSASA